MHQPTQVQAQNGGPSGSSSGGGSSHGSSGGSSSTSGLSSSDIKAAVLSCLSQNITSAIKQSNTTRINQTFINATILTIDNCIPSLSTTTAGHHHKIHIGTSSILTTLMPGIVANNTKAPKPTSLSSHDKNWRIGFEYGTNDGKVGVFDAATCSPVNDKRITNEFNCGEGYKNGYVLECTAPNNKFGCGDGPSTVK